MSMRNIGRSNFWIFRKVLARKCVELQKLGKDYRHDFTKKEPVLKLTIEITHEEFNSAVLEMENEILVKRLERANKKIMALQEKLNPPNTFAEQMQIDADEDMDFEEDEDFDGDCCPRCHQYLTGSGDCPSCDFPGPPV